MPTIRHGVLEANVVTTVTLEGNFAAVEVTKRTASDEIFFTVDGADPEIEGDDTEILPAAIGFVVAESPSQAATVVKLISEGTPSWSVKGIE